MKVLAARFEGLMASAFLLISTGFFWPPTTYFSKIAPAPEASNPLATAANAVLIAFLLVLTVMHRDEMLRAIRRGWPVVLLLLLAFASAFWSADPDLVLRRSTTLAATTLFALYLGQRWDLDRLVLTLLTLNAITVAGSLVVMAVAPKLGTSDLLGYQTAWSGAFTEKNTLGAVSAFGTMLAWQALVRGCAPRWLALPLIPLDLLLLYEAQSATPRVMLAVAAYVALIGTALRRRNGIGLAVGFVLILIGLAGVAVLILDWTAILAAINRGPTLTGRVYIWRMALAAMADHPWLGYGYSAFWRHGELAARTMWAVAHWAIPHAHNAWLEIGLDLGIVGMTALTLVWLIALYRGLRALYLTGATHAVFCLAVIVAILVENQLEYDFLKPSNFIWILFCIAFAYLGRQLAENRGARVADKPRLRVPLVADRASSRPIATGRP